MKVLSMQTLLALEVENPAAGTGDVTSYMIVLTPREALMWLTRVCPDEIAALLGDKQEPEA